MQIDDSYHGREVSLQVGDTLAITLSENLSTGFRWTIPPELRPRFGNVLRESEEKAQGEAAPPGKPGSRTLLFEAVAAGTGELELHYRRPWETGAAPARTFQLRVQVR